MEKAGILINKLLQQYNDKASAENLSITAQMLLAELQMQPAVEQKNFKAAVIMPGNRNTTAIAAQPEQIKEEVKPEPVMVEQKDLEANHVAAVEEKKEEAQTNKQENESIQKGENAKVEDKPEEKTQATNEVAATINVSESLQPPAHDVNETNKAEFDEPAKPEEKPGNFYSRFMPHDIPTLPKREPQQEQPKELHELKDDGNSEELSLNDRLKEIRKETGDDLDKEPVKDLRKAIGINDRYLFINELFRGDEAMYERSIKTINSFNILAEADYWIQRELKVKLGWPESEATKQFDALVRRRFA